jgi:hypothetical protein
MKFELLIFGATAFFIVNTNYDGKYVQIMKSWKKYYQMISIGFVGLSAYLFIKKYPGHSRSLFTHANGIIKYLPIYNKLLASGFVGEERRIEWIEALRQIHAQHKLFSIDYSIGLQESYNPSFLPNLGNFKLKRSVMNLKLDMLHEGDLLALLDGLLEQTTPFIVRECEIKRPVGAVVNAKNMVSNMQANCEIDWLTLRDPQLTSTLPAEAL